MLVDTAIVLGAGITDNKASPIFAARIKHAIVQFKSAKIKTIIFTGSRGRNKKVAESTVARNMALDAGIPKDKILVETKSRTTIANLTEAYKVMQLHSLKSAIIISDPLHMKRAIAIATEIGITAFTSPTPYTRIQSWQAKTKMLLRETYFYFGFLYQRYFKAKIFKR